MPSRTRRGRGKPCGSPRGNGGRGGSDGLEDGRGSWWPAVEQAPAAARGRWPSPGGAAALTGTGARPARPLAGSGQIPICAAVTASPEGFPPQDLRRFLELCAGEWLALCSHFDLVQAGAAAADDEEEAWHRSERGELRIAFLEPSAADLAGGLRITAPAGSVQELHFRSDGSFLLAADPAAEPGRWQLWPDGSLELAWTGSGRHLQERIWFTQPNLRLRSSVEHGAAEPPGRARFSSEIRRVSRPPA